MNYSSGRGKRCRRQGVLLDAFIIVLLGVDGLISLYVFVTAVLLLS